MDPYAPASWDDTGLSSLVRSPFIFPSLILHALLLTLILKVTVGVAPPPDIPIAVNLAELRTSTGTDTKSIGPAKGPGGPRTPPKLGTPTPPAPRTGKIDSGSLETNVPSAAKPEPAPPPPQPVALPGPKVLAADTHRETVNTKETSADSLVRLPTKESPTNLPTSAAADSDLNQKSLAALKGAGDGPGIKALKEGTQIPGALKGTGTGVGPYGVPGGSRNGTGIAGNGTGTGVGGGSNTGLKGTSMEDYNRYFEELKKRVKSVFKYPDDVTGDHKIKVRFSLDRAGKLIRAEILDSSDARLNRSALDAMRRASPFPPIPPSLKDLANEPLIMSFDVSNRIRG